MAKGKVADAVSLRVDFLFEKETKGTYRFQEQGLPESVKIGTLYVRKTALPNGAPKGLRVTVEEVK